MSQNSLFPVELVGFGPLAFICSLWMPLRAIGIKYLVVDTVMAAWSLRTV